jgi:hypothetical protein
VFLAHPVWIRRQKLVNGQTESSRRHTCGFVTVDQTGVSGGGSVDWDEFLYEKVEASFRTQGSLCGLH